MLWSRDSTQCSPQSETVQIINLHSLLALSFLGCQVCYNNHLQELHGVFRAVSAGSWNIDPLAYGGKPKEGSMYPAQVRVEYCPRCPPMEEQYFKPAIASNYFNPNRFRWELNERQASMLHAHETRLLPSLL